MVEARVRQRERIAAGDEDFAHFGMLIKIGDGVLDRVGIERFALLIRPNPFAQAVPAAHRAPVGRDQQDAIRVPVHEPGQRRVTHLGQGIGVGGAFVVQLARIGHALAQDGIVGGVGIRKRDIVVSEPRGILFDQAVPGGSVACAPAARTDKLCVGVPSRQVGFGGCVRYRQTCFSERIFWLSRQGGNVHAGALLRNDRRTYGQVGKRKYSKSF